MKKIVIGFLAMLISLSALAVETEIRSERETDVVESNLDFYPTMSYQGLFKDSNDDLIKNGIYKITFKIYNSVDGIDAIWKEIQEVKITDGIINCFIGTIEKLNLPFDRQYWLSVGINDDELPRMIMAGTPYSLHARRIAEDAIVAGKNISVSKDEDGKIVLSGDVSSGTSKAADNLEDSGTGIRMLTCTDSTLGARSVALGYDTNASGSYAFSVGRETNAAGHYSFASGQLSEATAAWSFASGYNSKATAWYSTALGNSCEANGDDSFAAGYNCMANGSYSVSLGNSNLADSTSCVALGNNTIAKDYFSTATGNGTEATGNSSFSLGSYTKARGSVSLAAGIQTKALGNQSTSLGNYFSNKYAHSFMIKYAGSLPDSSSTGAALFVNKNKVCIGLNDAEIDSMISVHSVNDKALFVNGDIYTKNLNLQTNVWADYVFEDDYDLKPLSEVEEHINKNGHLSGIIPEKEALSNGVNVGDIQVKLLEKIEELTLYIIEQDKRLSTQDAQIKELQRIIK
ncbi:MAG: hypothetical protein KAS62_11310 [Candidatus Delongbacteria bacterium]|nr:hypothetical protein [Candidatus Delongbacteria bacterium]